MNNENVVELKNSALQLVKDMCKDRRNISVRENGSGLLAGSDLPVYFPPLFKLPYLSSSTFQICEWAILYDEKFFLAFIFYPTINEEIGYLTIPWFVDYETVKGNSLLEDYQKNSAFSERFYPIGKRIEGKLNLFYSKCDVIKLNKILDEDLKNVLELTKKAVDIFLFDLVPTFEKEHSDVVELSKQFPRKRILKVN